MAGAEVIVLGSINADIAARVAALPRPGETVAGGGLSVRLGGKGANQAVAAARAGADVRMRGAIGTERFGLDFKALLAGYGVGIEGVAVLDGPSGAALIAVDGAGENMIVVSPGANGRAAEAGAFKAAPGALLLAQLELPSAFVRDAFRAQRSAGGATMLNAAPAVEVPPDLFDLADVLIVNETELSSFSGHPLGDEPEEAALAEAAAALRRREQVLIVTLGARGALAITDQGEFRVPARRVEARDATGAGDCFCGALAARLAKGAALEDALGFAAAAASICVTRDGAAEAMPTRAEIEALMAE